MIHLEHYTSIEKMTGILKSKKFQTAYPNNPGAADAVFNCFIVGCQYNKVQEYEGMGVKIIFEWSGETDYSAKSCVSPFLVDWKDVKSGILYNSPGWRAFIKPPLCGCFLKVYEVKIGDSYLKKYIEETTKSCSWLPKTIKEKKLKDSKENFKEKIHKSYKNKDLYIEITN
ncbi:hypothetical protein [Gilliamella sp. ESL0250]|uniref:hypothetical protein n=1 Tax=Gilliamella sp. ESL0250 TaxID=2705036 RepID=UPI00157FBE98|nr:hypothetical protein [Gilliamella sp. ESL0250]NUF50487.1 hypothetical protein [Gilliamella sp. ESL0250]